MHNVTEKSVTYFQGIDCLLVDARWKDGRVMAEADAVRAVDMLEKAVGVDPAARTTCTLYDSEIFEDEMVQVVDWREEDHGRIVELLLGYGGPTVLRHGVRACEVVVPEIATKWSMEEEDIVIYVHVGGAGEKVPTGAIPSPTRVEEVDMIEEMRIDRGPRKQIAKFISRKLGKLPRSGQERMELLRAQEDSLIGALTEMEGRATPAWEEMRAPKLMSMPGRENAAQHCMYTLVRTVDGEVGPLDATGVEAAQRRAPNGTTGRAPHDKTKGMLVVGAPGNKRAKSHLSFAKIDCGTGRVEESDRPSLVFLGKHVCCGRLVANHEGEEPCREDLARRAKRLEGQLQPAATRLMALLELEPEEECPFFRFHATVKQEMAPCANGGCRGHLGSCVPGRWASVPFPAEVKEMVEAAGAARKAALVAKERLELAAERARTVPEMMSTAADGPRRSPRLDKRQSSYADAVDRRQVPRYNAPQDAPMQQPQFQPPQPQQPQAYVYPQQHGRGQYPDMGWGGKGGGKGAPWNVWADGGKGGGKGGWQPETGKGGGKFLGGWYAPGVQYGGGGKGMPPPPAPPSAPGRGSQPPGVGQQQQERAQVVGEAAPPPVAAGGVPSGGVVSTGAVPISIQSGSVAAERVEAEVTGADGGAGGGGDEVDEAAGDDGEGGEAGAGDRMEDGGLAGEVTKLSSVEEGPEEDGADDELPRQHEPMDGAELEAQDLAEEAAAAEAPEERRDEEVTEPDEHWSSGGASQDAELVAAAATSAAGASETAMSEEDEEAEEAAEEQTNAIVKMMASAQQAAHQRTAGGPAGVVKAAVGGKGSGKQPKAKKREKKKKSGRGGGRGGGGPRV